VSTRERGAWLGQADVVPPRRGGGQGFRRMPLFLFCLYQFAYDFEYSIAGRHVAWLAARANMLT